MKTNRLHIIGIFWVTALFAVFTLMHQFDWLIPQSPAAPVASTTVPFPDAVEEHGGEDDITHDLSKPVFISVKSSRINIYMIFEDLFVPQVSTPPPNILA